MDITGMIIYKSRMWIWNELPLMTWEIITTKIILNYAQSGRGYAFNSKTHKGNILKNNPSVFDFSPNF